MVNGVEATGCRVEGLGIGVQSFGSVVGFGVEGVGGNRMFCGTLGILGIWRGGLPRNLHYDQQERTTLLHIDDCIRTM